MKLYFFGMNPIFHLLILYFCGMKYLIVGLGNPGEKYANTRHNVGFKVLDAFAKEHEGSFKLDKHAEIATVKFKGRIIILIKPTTFMNLSGKAVNYWMQQEKISIENLLVITDDLALPFGKLRMKGKGSDGGHNGLKDIEVFRTWKGNRKVPFFLSLKIIIFSSTRLTIIAYCIIQNDFLTIFTQK